MAMATGFESSNPFVIGGPDAPPGNLDLAAIPPGDGF